jgi:aspartate dehydrogenase
MSARRDRAPLRVGIAGAGAIGIALARQLSRKCTSGEHRFDVTGFAVRDEASARDRLVLRGLERVAIAPIAKLAEQSDVIVEAAHPDAFRAIAAPVLEQGKRLIVLASGALLLNWDLTRSIETGTIVIASGAICGLDGVRALASAGTIRSAKLISSKPPYALKDAPFVKSSGFNLSRLARARKLFAGDARGAVSAFPSNANVAATLALAGPGPEQTRVEIWADPYRTRNRHRIELRSDLADVEIVIDAQPSKENPRTSKLAAASVLAALDRMQSRVQFGS